jgi:hypothetical protein
MRKILISIILLFGTIGLFAQQNTFKYVVRANGGLQVGGSTLVKIDSITSSGGNIYFWSGGAILSAVPGGGSATWGAISGSLASQIDLTNALNLKANLVSPTFTGTPIVPGYVPTSRTVNSKALTSNISLTASDVGALSASDTASMLSKYARKYSPVFTGTPTVPGYVPTSRTVNGHVLSSNVSVTASDVGLGSVTNESKTTLFTSPVFTGIAKLDPTDTLATKAYARSVGGGTGSMVYPGAGIALSTGSAWGTSITNNSTNWNTAYSWVNTNGANAVTAYGWGNHASAGYVPNTRTVNGHALTGNVSVTASDVSLGNVTNESKATMFTNPTFTGTVGGISSSMVGLGNVTNESKSTMFSSPTFTGTVTMPTPFTLGGVSVTPTGVELNFVDGVTSAIQGQIDLKAPKANATLTGTTTTAALNIGGKDLSIDSVSYVDGKYAVWDGVDTVSPHINITDQVDISSVAAMQVDSLTKWVTVSQLTDSLAGFSGGLSAGDVATQINDTIVARLAVAVSGVRLADSTSGAGHYASDHRADLIEADLADYEIGIAASDTAAMLIDYLTEQRARKLDSDTTTLFVFGTGSGATADTALFNNNRYAGAFYNAGSDTLHVTELRGVLEDGTGTETISVQVSWDVNCFDSSPTNINTNALAITSLTSGTTDTSFNNNDIPPGNWVWCTLSGASKDNKPTMLILNMKGYKRNRKY